MSSIEAVHRTAGGVAEEPSIDSDMRQHLPQTASSTMMMKPKTNMTGIQVDHKVVLRQSLFSQGMAVLERSELQHLQKDHLAASDA